MLGFDQYAPYVLAAYGAFFAGVIWLIIGPLLAASRHKRRIRTIATRERTGTQND